MRIAIVEDDAVYAQQIKEYLVQYETEQGESIFVTHYMDGDEFVESYKGQFDIILMDIEMHYMDGMTAARIIRKWDSEVIIIFITNMAQYAIQGYEVDALDYILKPISYFAFSQRLARAIGRLKRRSDNYVTLSAKGGIRRVMVSTIYYIESQNHDLTFHTASGDFTATMSMRKIEEILSGQSFYKGNQCYLINLEHVEGIDGDCAIVKGTRLRLSRPRRAAFLAALADYMSEVVK